MDVTMDQAQLETIQKLKPGSVLKGFTGSGKSRTALGYYYYSICGGTTSINGEGETTPPKTPTPLIVITTAKKRDSLDWFKEAIAFGISSDPDSNFEGISMVVDSWNNIGKYVDVRDTFFIFDEQRLVGSGAWVKAFLKIAERNRWILLTATPADAWIDYAPVFIANGFYKNKTDFITQHVVYKHHVRYPQIDRYVTTDKLVRLRDSILVEIEYTSKNNTHTVEIPVSYDAVAFKRIFKGRWDIYKDRPLKTASEFFICMRRLVNSDPSRIDAILDIWKTHKKLIVFYNFDYELEILRSLKEVTTVAELNGHNHDPLPTGDSWIYLVQYTAGSEAWDATTTNVVVFYSLNYSYKVFKQSKGRIDRRTTPFTDLYYYMLVSGAYIDKAILRALKKKKNFQESRYDF